MGSKRDLVHIFSNFQIISISMRHLCPLHLLSNALKISLSIMELQWPEFVITGTSVLIIVKGTELLIVYVVMGDLPSSRSEYAPW